MSIFGMPDHRRSDAAKRQQTSTKPGFELPQEIAAAMRLMASPAAGVVAMSALGLGFASHAFGLWAGAVAGAVQASQRLFVPIASGEGGAAAEAAKPAVAPQRAKPALKVVAKSEPAERAPAVAPVKAAEPAAPAAKAEPVAAAPQAAPAVAKAEIEPVAKPAKVETALQPEDFHKPRSTKRPAAPDDLKAISGIGPKLEKVLNDLGVWTYAQIAAWERHEVAWIDDYLSFKGRIDRDGWIEQARSLSSQAKKSK